MWERDPESMRPAMARHDRIIEEAVRRAGGNTLRAKGEGDSSFSVFDGARAAAEAALELQRALAREPWPGEARIRVRVALHTGEAEHREGDYYGSAVNRTARLRDIAHGGQTIVSAVTRALLADDLPPGARLRDLGSHRLKDLSDPERVYQLSAADLEADFPPLRGLEAMPTNLPIQLTSFIGREAELAELRDLMLRARLLTLTGTGGCGKTRLAVELAAELTDHYRDGVWLVDLSTTSDPSMVASVVAETVGVHQRAMAGRPAGGGDLVEATIDHVGEGRVLVILDNCEHLVAACAELAETLLRRCPALAIMATSRELLAAAGEVTWRVPSLAVPDPRRLPEMEALAGFDAVRLLVDRARLHQRGFSLTEQNRAAVAQVCHRVDGIPLALELAAARIKVLPIEQIAERLDNAFALLTGGVRTALSRQQTLRAAVDWSHQLLDEGERALLRRLSVFAGSFSLDAAEACTAGEGVDDVVTLLGRLVDKSLVQHEPGQAWAPYRLLQTIRDYAGERLTESGETAELRDRHLAHYAGQAEEAAPELRGPNAASWLDRLESEHDNLRAALSWAVARKDPAGLGLAADLGGLWLIRGHLAEGRQWLEEAIAAAGGDEPGAGARALMSAGRLAMEQGDYPAARELHQQALEIAKRDGGREAVAMSLRYLAQVAFLTGDYPGSRGLFEMALQEARAIQLDWLVGVSLIDMTMTAVAQGEYAEALGRATEGLDIATRLGDRRNMALAQFAIGDVAMAEGDHGAALARYEDARTLATEVGDRRTTADIMLRLGVALARLGRAGDAVAVETAAVALARELDTPEVLVEGAHLVAFALSSMVPGASVRILAAVHAANSAAGREVPAGLLASQERSIQELRAQLGEADFSRFWAEGAGRDLVELVDATVRDLA
ncbi:MAG: hypothetical protein QOE92_882 [Chloroflexota bacterium]|nr:hypothetical protein [Chloroflexota bacterium]